MSVDNEIHRRKNVSPPADVEKAKQYGKEVTEAFFSSDLTKEDRQLLLTTLIQQWGETELGRETAEEMKEVVYALTKRDEMYEDNQNRE